MAIATEKFVPNLPPREYSDALNVATIDYSKAVSWLSIISSFDPSTLSTKYLLECVRRNPYASGEMDSDGTPPTPISERMRRADGDFSFAFRELEKCVKRIESEGLNTVTYKNARLALVQAIGAKGVLEYLKIEYERLGEEGCREQAVIYAQWLAAREKRMERDDQEWSKMEERFEDGTYTEQDLEMAEMLYGCGDRASLHEKIVMIRKGFLTSEGKPLTQREFAALIEYPINKYVKAEKVDKYCRADEGSQESPVEDILLDKLIMICHANPYWLFDYDCEAFMGHLDIDDDAVIMGDEPSVYCTPDVILRWIKAGKPKETCWEDGRTGEFIWADPVCPLP